MATPFVAGSSDDLTEKQQLDLAMRKEFGALWRDSRAQSSQMKGEQRAQDTARTSNYLEQKDNSAEPCMSSRQPAEFDLNMHWSTGPRSDDDAPGQNAKRSAANVQDDSPWQHLYTKTYNDIFSDQANLQAFYNEINGYACSGNSCSSGSDVNLDWTGARPHEAREPFTYPVLIDSGLRIWKYDAFHAVGNRLHAVSIPAPYPFMNNQPPRNREAVPVMASSGECAYITPYQPASCASFSAGDQVAQIDKFFSDNIAKGKVPGAVFVDAAVIEKWGKESSMKGTTALAVRQDISSLYIVLGLAGGFLSFTSCICCYLFRDGLKQCPRAVSSRVKSGWESCKNAASALWDKRPRRPLAPTKETGTQGHQDKAEARADESSVVVDSSDSDTDSGYLGDFSRSISRSSASGSSDEPESSDTKAD